MNSKVKPTLLFLLFTGLIIVGARITVAWGPVPFILSDFFVLLAGLMLGRWWGLMSVGLYLILGAVGLPVFAGGGAGWKHLIGDTGGYLFGYLVAVYVVGLISHSGKVQWWKDAIAVPSGQACLFICGVIGLKLATGMSWETALDKGFLAFLVPIAIKLFAAVLVAQLLRKVSFFRISGA